MIGKLTKNLMFSICATVIVGCDAEPEEGTHETTESRGISLSTTRRLNTIDLYKPIKTPSIMDGQLGITPCLERALIETDDGVLSRPSCAIGYWSGGEVSTEQPDELRYWFEDGPFYSEIRVSSYRNGILWQEQDVPYCTGESKFILHKGISITSDGRVISNPDNFFASCTNSAPGKAAEWGYPPWEGLAEFEATMRVIRADYCADGSTFTAEGQAVYFLDKGDKYSRHEDHPLEAVWDREGGGAICVEETRLGDEVPSCVPTCSVLGGLEFVKETYGDEVFAVTRLDHSQVVPGPHEASTVYLAESG